MNARSGSGGDSNLQRLIAGEVIDGALARQLENEQRRVIEDMEDTYVDFLIDLRKNLGEVPRLFLI